MGLDMGRLFKRDAWEKYIFVVDLDVYVDINSILTNSEI